MGGNAAGGNDTMRGGPGHDSMHGADGNDLMNGDSGGDYAYGDDGADVMWGGRGRPEVLNPDIPCRNDPGVNGQWIDVMFGGFGANATEAGADIIDYQPRAGRRPSGVVHDGRGLRRLGAGEHRGRGTPAPPRHRLGVRRLGP